MSITIAIGVAGLSLLILLFVQWKRKCNKMPPGPTPLPLIGNFHQICDSTMTVDITNLGKKYGDIFTVHFFLTPALIINSYKDIKQLLGSTEYSDIFSGRVSDYFSKNLLPDDMVFQTVTDGQQYMRRLVMRGVKQYGTHLKRVEQIVQEELMQLLERIKQKNGIAFDPLPDINDYVANIILILVCGERFSADHEMLKMTCELAEDFAYLFNYKRQIIMDVVPFATMIPSKLKNSCRRLKDNYDKVTEYYINMRKEDGKKHQDCLFELLEKEHKEGKISFNNIKSITLDIIIAGVFTTSPTIYCFLVALVHFPEVQKKIQEEVERVVGADRFPNLDDQRNLPYTQATILEMFRYFAPVSLPGPRSTLTDCQYKGYHIPKDTFVMYNVWQVHHDEEFWEEPYKFDPTRFLDTDGSLISPEHERRQRLLTFGVGKRSCVGEVLARLRIYLALTVILQQFDLKRDPSLPFPSPDPRTYQVKFLTVPPAYKVRFVPRHKTGSG